MGLHLLFAGLSLISLSPSWREPEGRVSHRFSACIPLGVIFLLLILLILIVFSLGREVCYTERGGNEPFWQKQKQIRVASGATVEIWTWLFYVPCPRLCHIGATFLVYILDVLHFLYFVFCCFQCLCIWVLEIWLFSFTLTRFWKIYGTFTAKVTIQKFTQCLYWHYMGSIFFLG